MQPLIDCVDAPDEGSRGGGRGTGSAAPRPGTGPTALDRLRVLAGRRRFWPVALLLGYAAQVLFRLSLVLHNYYPSVHADETSYLVIARVLAGGENTEMPVGVVIPGGYPLLLTPALWIGDNPASAYHLVMGLNALLNALVFPLLYLAARRLGVRRGVAYAMAAATSLLPPVIFYSQFVMSDTVLPVLLLGWLIAMHGWLSPGSARRRTLHAVAMGLLAGYTMATHDRGGVVVALTAAVLLLVLAFGWVPRRPGLAGLGALVVGVGFAKALGWVVGKLLRGTPDSTVGSQVMENVTDPALLAKSLTRTVGQLWYLVTSTWGLGALALAFCVAVVFRRRAALAERIPAACLVLLAVGIALAAAAGLQGTDDRVDNWVYARYLAPLAPVYFLVGLVVLHRAGTRALLRLAAAGAAFATGAALLVFLHAGGELRKQVIPWTIPDAQFLASTWEGLHLWRTLGAALLVLGACLLLRLAGGTRVVWAVVVCLGLFAGYATSTITANVSEDHIRERRYEAVDFNRDAGIRRDEDVVFAWDIDWGMRMAQAYEIYDARVWWRDPRWQPVPKDADVVVTPLPKEKGQRPESYWPNRAPEWYVAKVDTERNWIVWRRR